MLQKTAVGFISIYSLAPNRFSLDDARRLEGFAQQGAVGIEKARLIASLEQYTQELEERVRERTAKLEEQYRLQAAQEERQRLARELHDAVSQTLFSASVMAETLPRLWDRKPELVRNGLTELHHLTRGALASMRTLLLELRPEALAGAKLETLLRQLGEALVGRTGTAVSLDIAAISPLPTDVHLAFYRVSQEALNNIARHAGATSVSIRLQEDKGQIRLEIQDNGRGFETGRVPAEHLGLNIMGERAQNIGADLQINSTPGQGTVVVLAWLPEADRDQR